MDSEKKQEREIDSGNGTKLVDAASQGNKTKPVRDLIGSVVSTLPPFNLSNIPRRPRSKRKRKFKGKEALSRPKEKLNSGVFDDYLK